MELFYEEYAGHDIDIVLTTRELTRMIRATHIEPTTLQDVPCDELMRDASGAGVIFGATGGVMEAALRTSYFLITGKNPDADAFHAVRRTREDEFTMTAEIPIGNLVIKTAIVSGLGNARRLIDRIERDERACIADMDVVVYGRATHIHAHFALVHGNELTLGARFGVVDLDHGIPILMVSVVLVVMIGFNGAHRQLR